MRCKLTVSTKIRSQWLLWVVMAKANLHWWNVTWLQCKLWCSQDANIPIYDGATQWDFFQATTQEKTLCEWTIFKKLSNLFLLSQQLIEFRKKKKFFRWERTKKFWHRGIWYKSNQINDFWYLSLGFQALLTFNCPVDCYLRVFLGSTEEWFL